MGKNKTKSGSDKKELEKGEYYCKNHGENKSHKTKDCRDEKKKKPRNRSKQVNSVKAEGSDTDEDKKQNNEIAKLKKQINKLQLDSDKKEKSKEPRRDKEKDKSKTKKKKKRTPSEERAYFEKKDKKDYEEFPTMSEWQDLADDGKLDDDKACRFCKGKNHKVKKCKKLLDLSLIHI